MKKSIKYSLIVTLVALFSVALMPELQAQGPPPPPQSGNSGNGTAPPVPIDGGISLLLAAGAALGGKKLYDLKNKGEEEV